MAHDEAVQIQNVRFLNITACRAIEIAQNLMEDSRPHTIGFVHAHCINVARKDPDYRRIINNFDEVLPDGIGLYIAARLKGVRIKEDLNGTDLSPKFFTFLAEKKARVFMLGGHPGVAERAGKILTRTYDGLVVCGFSHGYDLEKRDKEICEAIKTAVPDVVVVSMGTPIQEKWIASHKDLFGKKLFVSVGGLFDFIAGVYPRAPLWVRKRIRQEWFFRLCCDPKRLWKRYLIGNPVFLFYAFREAVREKKGQRER